VLTEGSHVTEGLGDGAEGQRAEVGHDRVFGELLELVSGLDSRIQMVSIGLQALARRRMALTLGRIVQLW